MYQRWRSPQFHGLKCRASALKALRCSKMRLSPPPDRPARKTVSRLSKGFTLMALFWGFVEQAGACPPGFTSVAMQSMGQPVCVPVPRLANAPAQRAPESRWESRWGAFAVGSTNHSGGVLGVAAHRVTEQQARDAALGDCAEKGGKECQLTLAFHDQCGAVAWGDQRVTAYGAATTEVASTLAMKRCAEIADNCSIYYADCSYPARIR